MHTSVSCFNFFFIELPVCDLDTECDQLKNNELRSCNGAPKWPKLAVFCCLIY